MCQILKTIMCVCHWKSILGQRQGQGKQPPFMRNKKHEVAFLDETSYVVTAQQVSRCSDRLVSSRILNRSQDKSHI